MAEPLRQTWEAFSRAIEPAQVCIKEIEVGPTAKFHGVDTRGRYSPTSRRIRIDAATPEIASRTLRHELCHGWHEQVLVGPPPDDVFRFSSTDLRWLALSQELAGWSANRTTKEAFAFTCQIDPAFSLSILDEACEQNVAQEALSYLADGMYTSFEPDVVHVRPVLDLLLPDEVLRGEEPTRFSLVEEVAPGHLSAWIEFDSNRATLVFINLATGELRSTSGHLDGLPPLDSPRPGEPARPDELTMKLGGSFGTTEAAVLTVSTPEGSLDHVFVRSDDEGHWRAVRGACALSRSDPDLADFFVAGSGTALWSAVLAQGRIILHDWSNANSDSD
ncbi:MAG: hypothetical protein KTR31_37785 [Myxococcales bacterium]|nr:hypothetical protein [Myxococcales bacterium]